MLGFIRYKECAGRRLNLLVVLCFCIDQILFSLLIAAEVSSKRGQNYFIKATSFFFVSPSDSSVAGGSRETVAYAVCVRLLVCS